MPTLLTPPTLEVVLQGLHESEIRYGIQNEPPRLIFVGGGQEELEAHLADAPAASWEEAADKVRRTLVEAVLEDLERLASAPP